MANTSRTGPNGCTTGQAVDIATQEEEATAPSVPYSAFTKPHKVVLVTLIAIAGFFSPFTAFIYFPSLQSIATDLDVSLELMNITVIVYLLVQAIVPSVMGDLSDNIGRRPVYLVMFALYCAASIGLALQRNYAALLVLRMVQSAGSSATIALAYGVIGDIAAPHQRGIYVGVSHIGFNCAPALGPVIGGVIADKAGWPWIFVFLAAFSGALLILLATFLRETSRKIVGNGSVPATGINATPYELWRDRKCPPRHTHHRLHVPDIRPCLKIIFHRHTFPVLLVNAIFYAMYACAQASMAPLLQRYYGLSPFKAGLCYLSYGVSAGTASSIVGMITDRDYRVTAKSHGLSIDRVRGDDILGFPIERARLRTVLIYIPICSAATLCYGWTISQRAHLAAPLTLQFIAGFAVTGIFNVCNTLIVDTNPDAPATASAAVSITRCLLAAAGVAVVEVLLKAIGPGWTFTLIGGLCWTTLPIVIFVRRKGWDWRRRKAQQSLIGSTDAAGVNESKSG